MSSEQIVQAKIVGELSLRCVCSLEVRAMAIM